jgi:hypothetical protein
MRHSGWLGLSLCALATGSGLILLTPDRVGADGVTSKQQFRSRITVDHPAVDLGKIRQGTSHSVSFHLTNRSESEVRLSLFWSSCDCARVDLSKEPLPPGAEIDIPMSWRIGGHRGVCGSRVILSAAQADGAAEQIVLRVQAEVIPDVDLTPKDLTFTRGRSATQQVRVGPLAAGAAIDSVESARPFVKVAFDQRRQVIDVSYDAPADPRDSDWVTLDVRTSSPNEPSIRYTVWLKDDDLTEGTTGRPQ